MFTSWFVLVSDAIVSAPLADLSCAALSPGLPCRANASLVEFGFSSINDVRSTRPARMDNMESFVLAETLKYAPPPCARCVSQSGHD